MLQFQDQMMYTSEDLINMCPAEDFDSKAMSAAARWLSKFRGRPLFRWTRNGVVLVSHDIQDGCKTAGTEGKEQGPKSTQSHSIKDRRDRMTTAHCVTLKSSDPAACGPSTIIDASATSHSPDALLRRCGSIVRTAG